MTERQPTAPSYPTISDAARRFLEAPRFASIATLNPDGSPLQAVAWYMLDGDVVVFNSRIGRQWPANLMRDPRVSVVVADAYDYVEMRGEVEVDENGATGQAVISDLARRYHRDPAKAAAQIAVFAQQQRVTFRLRPRRIFTHLDDE